jgi:Ras-related protein Rab-1A
MSSADYDFVFKILLIGNSAVGKSSLLMRFADNVFHETFLPTIGVDFKIRTIEQAGSIVKLQMWDTAGQEKFKTITSAYFKGAQGIILVFDLTDQQSFLNVQNWLAESERYSGPNVVRILVGNKCDLVEQRQVSRKQAETYAAAEGMRYYESSAKDNSNVETLFKELAGNMKDRFSQPYLEKYKQTKTYLQPIKPKNPEVRKTCC